MRTTIDLPDSILMKAKQAAAERQTTLRALIIEALQGSLNRKTTAFSLRDVSFGNDPEGGEGTIDSAAINSAIDDARATGFRA